MNDTVKTLKAMTNSIMRMPVRLEANTSNNSQVAIPLHRAVANVVSTLSAVRNLISNEQYFKKYYIPALLPSTQPTSIFRIPELGILGSSVFFTKHSLNPKEVILPTDKTDDVYNPIPEIKSIKHALTFGFNRFPMEYSTEWSGSGIADYLQITFLLYQDTAGNKQILLKGFFVPVGNECLNVHDVENVVPFCCSSVYSDEKESMFQYFDIMDFESLIVDKADLPVLDLSKHEVILETLDLREDPEQDLIDHLEIYSKHHTDDRHERKCINEYLANKVIERIPFEPMLINAGDVGMICMPFTTKDNRQMTAITYTVTDEQVIRSVMSDILDSCNRQDSDIVELVQSLMYKVDKIQVSSFFDNKRDNDFYPDMRSYFEKDGNNVLVTFSFFNDAQQSLIMGCHLNSAGEVMITLSDRYLEIPNHVTGPLLSRLVNDDNFQIVLSNDVLTESTRTPLEEINHISLLIFSRDVIRSYLEHRNHISNNNIVQ